MATTKSAALLAELPTTLAPTRSLLRYYALSCLMTGPGFPFAFTYFYFRYRTLRYELDDEGITMRWGVLFHREISLSYARIQDIHLSSNVVERWLGLGKVQVQTASGSAGAEMTIEGLPAPHTIRDFLYARMRGARQAEPDGLTGGEAPAAAAGDPQAALAGGMTELTRTLRDIAREVRALNASLGSVAGDRDA